MKIGILGGSFDPVHIGHISMAQCAMDKAGLDKVIFLPNGNPPHKIGCIASSNQRYNMLSIALQGYSGFAVSDYEITRTEPSYTVDSMRYFRKKYPFDEVMFIVGADSLDYINTWACADKLRDENVFIAVNRNFSQSYSFDKNVDLCRKNGYKIITAQMPPIDVSSTEIRQMVKADISIHGLTDNKVCEYIFKNNIYR